MSQISETTTRERILDVAERLFAESGFEATSLRQITTDADANLAAVNYHFGSKDELIRQVLARRIGQLNAQRMQMLDDVEADSGPEGPTVEQIVESFVGPPVRMAEHPDGRVFRRLVGQAHAQPDHGLTEFIVGQFRDVAIRFAAALQATPGCTEQRSGRCPSPPGNGQSRATRSARGRRGPRRRGRCLRSRRSRRSSGRGSGRAC